LIGFVARNPKTQYCRRSKTTSSILRGAFLWNF
jgi:hypothetical protein